METKKLSSEVLMRLSKLESLKKKSETPFDLHEFINAVFTDLINDGYEVTISKTDLAMLHSLDIDSFVKTINDQVLKTAHVSTPIT